MSKVMRGVVKWFNNAKGFGFIEHESGKDVFVHYSVITSDGYKSLKDGEVVEYEISEGPKGFHASRVARVEAPPEVPATDGQALNGDAAATQPLAAEVTQTMVPPSEQAPLPVQAGIEKDSVSGRTSLN
jgi:CspA family cold shock protein